VTNITNLDRAIGNLVHDGDSVALEGFSHLVPFAAGHEMVRRGFQNLTLIRLSADLISDELIGAGCVRKLVFSWAGNPGVGLLHRFRDAIENHWPQPLEIEEHTHAGLATAFTAGAARLPFGVLRGYTGTDLEGLTSTVQPIECPFTGERIMAVRAINPDVAIIHAQQADIHGNVLIWGVTGLQKEAVLSAKRAMVTVEEVREELQSVPNSVILPSWLFAAVVHCPGGARPSYAHGYYSRDNRFYRNWEVISRDRQAFRQWLNENVLHGSVMQYE